MVKLDIPVIGRVIQQWMKRKIFFTVSMIGVIIVTNLICINWFTLLTEDGISTYHLLQVKSYQWDDVSFYKIGTSNDSLSMKLVMEDGTSHEILANGSFVSPIATASVPNLKMTFTIMPYMLIRN